MTQGKFVWMVAGGLSLLLAGCGGSGNNNTTPPVTTYVLTVDSATPASGVAITVSPADNTGATSGSTGFTRTYNAGTSITLSAPTTSAGNNFSSWSGCTTATTVTCTVTLNGNTTVTANYAAPAVPYTLTVNSTNPASGVAITAAPADNNKSTGGNTSFTLTYNSGTSVTLTAPATAGSNTFGSWTGCTSATTVTCTITISANATVTAGYTTPLVKPTVTVTPASTTITTTSALSVGVAVSGGGANPTPTGSVTLSSGTYTSAATTLSSGSATINIPAGTLATGSDTLTATYTPDAASSTVYATASGMSAAVTVAMGAAVSVDQTPTTVAVTNQLLGMNMAAWYDQVANATAVNTAFGQAGIKAVRWPGGSWSDDYHWGQGGATPFMCQTSAPVTGGWGGDDTTAQMVNAIVTPGGYDLALTANYGSDEACTGGGDPKEAAAWAAAEVTAGVKISHMTVGNEEYGTWESDLHANPHDPATYAAAVTGASGYYQLIKAASPNTLVGVVADAQSNCCVADWDSVVLGNAAGSYDFVEFHFYPQNPGGESDTFLVQQAAQVFTQNINTLKAELKTANEPNTPIYVGEMGSVSSNPGKQSWSITQGLFAGQVLGEMMNDGISRATWWIGFGNCNAAAGLFNSSLYGWQNFGAYNVFADGAGDAGCTYGGPIGTMSPTAQAFNLFQNVAVNGEHVLTPTVTGDTTDVRAYAATHSGGTALVLFNLNQTVSAQVTVTLSTENNSSDVTMMTYSKAIYDQTNPANANPVWAPPTSTDMGAQSLPLTLTLAPWSMNVVVIK